MARLVGCAVALPKVVDAPTSRIRAATPGETLLRLAPSSLVLLPHAGLGGGFETMADLIRCVPTFWLELGRDLASRPERIDEILTNATTA